MKILSLFVLASILPSLVWAQSLEEQRLKSQSKLNYLNDLTFQTNTQQFSSVDNFNSLTYTFGLKYTPQKKNNFWFFARLNKTLNGGEERFDLLDTIVRYERLLGKAYGFNNRFRLNAILPTNFYAHDRTTFRGAISAQLRSGRVLAKSWYLNWINTLRWNTHVYRITEQGFPNTQATLNTMVNFSYSGISKMILSSTLGWSFAKGYTNIFKDQYILDANVTYSITPKLSFTAGMTTQSSPIAANGRDLNFKIFDERDSTYYLSLSHFY